MILKRRTRAAWSAGAAVVVALGFLGFSSESSAKKRQTLTVQFLNVSDWHGQLDPISVFGVGDVGGAAVIAAYWNADRAAHPSFTFTAGDAFGATPPISNFFDDEPTILAMNLMGFQADSLGNHNFDGGIDHLRYLMSLADFPYLSSNLDGLDEEGLSDVAPFRLFEVGGVTIGVVGVTNPDAPSLLFPGDMGSLVVTDPVSAANGARAAAKAAGAKVVVAIVHMGVTGFDDEGNPTGPLVDFANAVGGFDVIFGDHTDVQWSGVLNGQLVVENRSKGLTYARTLLEVDPGNGRVDSATVQFVTPLASAVTPDSAIEALLAPYRSALSGLFDGVIGVATDVFPRGGNIERLGEVAIGNLVTDSMRLRYGTQVAFTNGGGIRASLPSSYLPSDTSLRRSSVGYAPGPPYDLVGADPFTVLPFGNSVVTRTVTGAQLHAILEHGVSAMPGANGRFAQVSGLRFTYSLSQPVGSRVVSVTLDDGTPVLADQTLYSLATNDFVNAGGDGYVMLADGQGTHREFMAKVLLDYIREQGTITPVIEGRIVQLP